VVAQARARDRVVGWSRVLKPATMWFGGDEAGGVSHRVVLFWRSHVPGHSIASGVWGSVGCGQQLRGGGGPLGAYAGVCSRWGRCWLVSLTICTGHTTAEGAWWMCEPEPTTTGHHGGGLHKLKLAAAGWWWPFGTCVGTRGHQEGLWLMTRHDLDRSHTSIMNKPKKNNRGCGWWLASRTGVRL